MSVESDHTTPHKYVCQSMEEDLNTEVFILELIYKSPGKYLFVELN